MKRIFPGKVSTLSLGAFTCWFKQIMSGNTKSDIIARQELRILFAKHASHLTEETVSYEAALKYLKKVNETIECIYSVATTPIWGAVVCLSEGNFTRAAAPGVEGNDRKLLAAAARAFREYLADEKANGYLTEDNVRRLLLELN